MIRKSYIGEATLCHFTETGPVGLPIFSGLIILTEHTMGLSYRTREGKMCHALAQIPTCMEMVASGKQTRVKQKPSAAAID